MSFYFALKDLPLRNITVKAGQPLPERFQNRYAAKLLKRDLGDGGIGECSANDDTYKVVKTADYDALVKEVAALRNQVQKTSKTKSSEG